MRLNQNIRKGSYTLEPADWEGVSEQAKELAKSLLSVDPAARLSPAKALDNAWIKSGGSDTPLKNFHKNLNATFS